MITHATISALVSKVFMVWVLSAARNQGGVRIELCPSIRSAIEVRLTESSLIKVQRSRIHLDIPVQRPEQLSEFNESLDLTKIAGSSNRSETTQLIAFLQSG